MTSSNVGFPSASLPTTRSLTLVYALSLLLALLMTIASVAGLLYQTVIYPTEGLRNWVVTNDAFNLVVGLPLLLLSMWLTRRGKLIGLLCWLGALFYVLYVYLPYVIAVPFGVLFLPHLLLATLSVYALISLVASTDGQAVRQRLEGIAPARTTGGILLGLALLILLRQTGLIVIALTSNALVAPQELGQWVDDLAVACPVLVGVGVELWRRRALGYVGGAGLLLAYGILTLILIPVMVFDAPIDVGGIAIVAAMALLCLAPFAFFVRGAIRT